MRVKIYSNSAVTNTNLRIDKNLISRINQRLRNIFAFKSEGSRAFIANEQSQLRLLQTRKGPVLNVELHYDPLAFECASGSIITQRILLREFGIKTDVYGSYIQWEETPFREGNVWHVLLKLKNPAPFLKFFKEGEDVIGFFKKVGNKVLIDVTSFRNATITDLRHLEKESRRAIKGFVFNSQPILMNSSVIRFLPSVISLSKGEVLMVAAGIEVANSYEFVLVGKHLRLGEDRFLGAFEISIRIPPKELSATRLALEPIKHDPLAILSYLHNKGFVETQNRGLDASLHERVEKEADVLFHFIEKLDQKT